MKVNKRLAGRLLPALLAVFLAAGCRAVSNPVKPGQAEAAETEIAEADPAEAAEVSAVVFAEAAERMPYRKPERRYLIQIVSSCFY